MRQTQEWGGQGSRKLSADACVLCFLDRFLLFLAAALLFTAQSHMEVEMRWVESITFLFKTSKLGDLLWTAGSLALLPPSVICFFSLSWLYWCSMAADRIHCLKLKQEAAGRARCFLPADWTKKMVLFSFWRWTTKVLNDFLEVTQNVSRRRENKTYFSWGQCCILSLKSQHLWYEQKEVKEKGKRISGGGTCSLTATPMQHINGSQASAQLHGKQHRK